MPFEYEHRYRDFDKSKMYSTLISRYGKQNVKKETFLLRNTIYTKPDDLELYIRVRETGKHVFLTMKYHKDEYPIEYEVEVSNAKTIHDMIRILRYPVKYVVEKIRETWTIPDGEIAFDQHPGLPEIMEIETTCKCDLTRIEKMLKVKPVSFGATLLYKHFYDIDTHSNSQEELSFASAPKNLYPRIKKNHKQFKDLLEKQRRKIRKLCDKM